MRHGDKYWYCIFPGNGYNIIKSAIDTMPNWHEIKKEDVFLPVNCNKINFIWKPTNFNPKMYGIIDNILYKS